VSLFDTLMLPIERAAIHLGDRWAAATPLRAAVASQVRRTWRSPMEWTTLYALLLGGLGVALIDQPLALWLKEVVGGNVEGFFRVVTDLGLGGVWLIPSGVMCLGILLARRVAISPAARDRCTQAAWVPGFLFLSVALSGILNNLLKFMIGRTRPAQLFESGIADFIPFSHGWAVNSFPSGHAQAVMAAMVALTLILPRYDLAFLALGLLAAASRVVLTAHYFSDVVVGAWLGAFVTLALHKLLVMRGINVRLRLERDRRLGW